MKAGIWVVKTFSLIFKTYPKFNVHFSCAYQVTLEVKTPPDNARDLRDAGLIPGLGQCSGGGYDNHSNILNWRIPRTEELGRPQSLGSPRVGHD